MNSRHTDLARIDLLDYARFTAALAVMAFHYLYYGIHDGRMPAITLLDGLSGIARYGYLGVEFFFIISGYVIFFSSQNRTPSQFAVARAVRLYPAFLCGLITTSTAAFFWGTKLDTVYLSQFLTNLTMVPRLFGRAFVDGSYWTLVLELYFYATVMILLLSGWSDKLKVFFIIWPVLIFCAALAGGSDWPIFGGYYSYFAAGALFAMRRDGTSALKNCALLLCFYNSLQFSGVVNRADACSQFVVMSAITTFYLFFWILNKETIRGIRLPFAALVGNVTYPLYLVHQVIGYLIIWHVGTEQNKGAVIALTMLSMLVLALIIHFCIEVRLRTFWRAIFHCLIGVPVRRLEKSVFRSRKYGGPE